MFNGYNQPSYESEQSRVNALKKQPWPYGDQYYNPEAVQQQQQQQQQLHQQQQPAASTWPIPKPPYLGVGGKCACAECQQGTWYHKDQNEVITTANGQEIMVLGQNGGSCGYPTESPFVNQETYSRPGPSMPMAKAFQPSSYPTSINQGYPPKAPAVKLPTNTDYPNYDRNSDQYLRMFEASAYGRKPPEQRQNYWDGTNGPFYSSEMSRMQQYQYQQSCRYPPYTNPPYYFQSPSSVQPYQHPQQNSGHPYYNKMQNQPRQVDQLPQASYLKPDNSAASKISPLRLMRKKKLLGHIGQGSPPRPVNPSSENAPKLDVRRFLATWAEDEETPPPPQMVVLDCQDINPEQAELLRWYEENAVRILPEAASAPPPVQQPLMPTQSQQPQPPKLQQPLQTACIQPQLATAHQPVPFELPQWQNQHQIPSPQHPQQPQVPQQQQIQQQSVRLSEPRPDMPPPVVAEKTMFADDVKVPEIIQIPEDPPPPPVPPDPVPEKGDIENTKASVDSLGITKPSGEPVETLQPSELIESSSCSASPSDSSDSLPLLADLPTSEYRKNKFLDYDQPCFPQLPTSSEVIVPSNLAQSVVPYGATPPAVESINRPKKKRTRKPTIKFSIQKSHDLKISLRVMNESERSKQQQEEIRFEDSHPGEPDSSDRGLFTLSLEGMQGSEVIKDDSVGGIPKKSRKIKRRFYQSQSYSVSTEDKSCDDATDGFQVQESVDSAKIKLTFKRRRSETVSESHKRKLEDVVESKKKKRKKLKTASVSDSSDGDALSADTTTDYNGLPPSACCSLGDNHEEPTNSLDQNQAIAKESLLREVSLDEAQAGSPILTAMPTLYESFRDRSETAVNVSSDQQIQRNVSAIGNPIIADDANIHRKNSVASLPNSTGDSPKISSSGCRNSPRTSTDSIERELQAIWNGNTGENENSGAFISDSAVTEKEIKPPDSIDLCKETVISEACNIIKNSPSVVVCSAESAEDVRSTTPPPPMDSSNSTRCGVINYCRSQSVVACVDDDDKPLDLRSSFHSDRSERNSCSAECAVFTDPVECIEQLHPTSMHLPNDIVSFTVPEDPFQLQSVSLVSDLNDTSLCDDVTSEREPCSDDTNATALFQNLEVMNNLKVDEEPLTPNFDTMGDANKPPKPLPSSQSDSAQVDSLHIKSLALQMGSEEDKCNRQPILEEPPVIPKGILNGSKCSDSDFNVVNVSETPLKTLSEDSKSAKSPPFEAVKGTVNILSEAHKGLEAEFEEVMSSKYESSDRMEANTVKSEGTVSGETCKMSDGSPENFGGDGSNEVGNDDVLQAVPSPRSSSRLSLILSKTDTENDCNQFASSENSSSSLSSRSESPHSDGPFSCQNDSRSPAHSYTKENPETIEGTPSRSVENLNEDSECANLHEGDTCLGNDVCSQNTEKLSVADTNESLPSSEDFRSTLVRTASNTSIPAECDSDQAIPVHMHNTENAGVGFNDSPPLVDRGTDVRKYSPCGSSKYAINVNEKSETTGNCDNKLPLGSPSSDQNEMRRITLFDVLSPVGDKDTLCSERRAKSKSESSEMDSDSDQNSEPSEKRKSTASTASDMALLSLAKATNSESYPPDNQKFHASENPTDDYEVSSDVFSPTVDMDFRSAHTHIGPTTPKNYLTSPSASDLLVIPRKTGREKKSPENCEISESGDDDMFRHSLKSGRITNEPDLVEVSSQHGENTEKSSYTRRGPQTPIGKSPIEYELEYATKDFSTIAQWMSPSCYRNADGSVHVPRGPRTPKGPAPDSPYYLSSPGSEYLSDFSDSYRKDAEVEVENHPPLMSSTDSVDTSTMLRNVKCVSPVKTPPGGHYREHFKTHSVVPPSESILEKDPENSKRPEISSRLLNESCGTFGTTEENSENVLLEDSHGAIEEDSVMSIELISDENANIVVAAPVVVSEASEVVSETELSDSQDKTAIVHSEPKNYHEDAENVCRTIVSDKIEAKRAEAPEDLVEAGNKNERKYTEDLELCSISEGCNERLSESQCLDQSDSLSSTLVNDGNCTQEYVEINICSTIVAEHTAIVTTGECDANAACADDWESVEVLEEGEIIDEEEEYIVVTECHELNVAEENELIVIDSADVGPMKKDEEKGETSVTPAIDVADIPLPSGEAPRENCFDWNKWHEANKMRPSSAPKRPPSCDSPFSIENMTLFRNPSPPRSEGRPGTPRLLTLEDDGVGDDLILNGSFSEKCDMTPHNLSAKNEVDSAAVASVDGDQVPNDDAFQDVMATCLERTKRFLDMGAALPKSKVNSKNYLLNSSRAQSDEKCEKEIPPVAKDSVEESEGLLRPSFQKQSDTEFIEKNSSAITSYCRKKLKVEEKVDSAESIEIVKDSFLSFPKQQSDQKVSRETLPIVASNCASFLDSEDIQTVGRENSANFTSLSSEIQVNMEFCEETPPSTVVSAKTFIDREVNTMDSLNISKDILISSSRMGSDLKAKDVSGTSAISSRLFHNPVIPAESHERSKDVLLSSSGMHSDMELSGETSSSNLSLDCPTSATVWAPEILPVDNWPYLEEEVPLSPSWKSSDEIESDEVIAEGEISNMLPAEEHPLLPRFLCAYKSREALRELLMMNKTKEVDSPKKRRSTVDDIPSGRTKKHSKKYSMTDYESTSSETQPESLKAHLKCRVSLERLNLSEEALLVKSPQSDNNTTVATVDSNSEKYKTPEWQPKVVLDAIPMPISPTTKRCTSRKPRRVSETGNKKMCAENVQELSKTVDLSQSHPVKKSRRLSFILKNCKYERRPRKNSNASCSSNESCSNDLTYDSVVKSTDDICSTVSQGCESAKNTSLSESAKLFSPSEGIHDVAQVNNVAQITHAADELVIICKKASRKQHHRKGQTGEGVEMKLASRAVKKEIKEYKIDTVKDKEPQNALVSVTALSKIKQQEGESKSKPRRDSGSKSSRDKKDEIISKKCRKEETKSKSTDRLETKRNVDKKAETLGKNYELKSGSEEISENYKRPESKSKKLDTVITESERSAKGETHLKKTDQPVVSAGDEEEAITKPDDKAYVKGRNRRKSDSRSKTNGKEDSSKNNEAKKYVSCVKADIKKTVNSETRNEIDVNADTPGEREEVTVSSKAIEQQLTNRNVEKDGDREEENIRLIHEEAEAKRKEVEEKNSSCSSGSVDTVESSNREVGEENKIRCCDKLSTDGKEAERRHLVKNIEREELSKHIWNIVEEHSEPSHGKVLSNGNIAEQKEINQTDAILGCTACKSNEKERAEEKIVGKLETNSLEAEQGRCRSSEDTSSEKFTKSQSEENQSEVTKEDEKPASKKPVAPKNRISVKEYTTRLKNNGQVGKEVRQTTSTATKDSKHGSVEKIIVDSTEPRDAESLPRGVKSIGDKDSCKKTVSEVGSVESVDKDVNLIESIDLSSGDEMDTEFGSKDQSWVCVCGFRDETLREKHIQEHSFHCQSCHLAFMSEQHFIGHLNRSHPDIAKKHHCLLCEMSFSSDFDYHEHMKSREHQHIEAVEKSTIQTLFTLLTGHDCPVLGPVAPRPDWLPSEAGTVHFYHQATPLSLAIQYWKRKNGQPAVKP